MATKTISLELDAYEKLLAAKRGRESFSSVVRRAILSNSKKTGEAMLDMLRSRSVLLDEEELDTVEKASGKKDIPVSPWDE
jgi:predicted CopG family antitoxin